MTTSMWNPIREMEALRRQFEDFFQAVDMDRWELPSFRSAFLPGVSARNYPLLNVGEDKDHVYVEALAPGLNPDTLEISVLNNTLRISGEKPAIGEKIRPEAYHRNERSAGRFVRTITLPVEVNGDKVAAEYKNGLLGITLPKAEAAKPKQISVVVH